MSTLPAGNHNAPSEIFVPGAMVIATLSNPREKFWGMILALAAEGLSLSGAELASFEDLAVMVRDGEPFTPAVNQRFSGGAATGACADHVSAARRWMPPSSRSCRRASALADEADRSSRQKAGWFTQRGKQGDRKSVV